MALQPCAMAMGADDDHDCPHCPPTLAEHHDGHAMSSDALAGHDMPCATRAADCSVSDEYSVDGRTGQLKLNDVPSDWPVAILPFAEFLADIQPKRTTDKPLKVSHPPGSSPPLNILYCVYLD